MLMTHQLKKKQCYSKQDRSGSFMINGVKKLEFMFKTHTETINPIYWAPSPKKQCKISERSNTMLQNTFGVCSSTSKTAKDFTHLSRDFLGVTLPKQI